MQQRVELHHLEQAEAHIASARKHLGRQRELVTGLQNSSAPGANDQKREAEAVLRVMESNMRALEGHRGFILEKLGLYQLGESGTPLRRERET